MVGRKPGGAGSVHCCAVPPFSWQIAKKNVSVHIYKILVWPFKFTPKFDSSTTTKILNCTQCKILVKSEKENPSIRYITRRCHIMKNY